MKPNSGNKQPMTNIVMQALEAVYDTEVEVVGSRRVERIAEAAVAKQTFNQVFDSEKRGAQLDITETLKLLLLSAQIVLVLVEIWEHSGRNLTRKEFEKRAKSAVPSKSQTRKFRELIAKVYDLLVAALAAASGKTDN
jgi:hypothetical protein